MASSEHEEDLQLDSVFPEPERPPTPEHTIQTYSRATVTHDITIRLVGNHPLWAHYLWNASRSFASFLDSTNICHGCTVLELGAGGALPSIIAVLTGASAVVVTDYPDSALIDNIRYNISANVPLELQRNIVAQGYVWGKGTQPLCAALPSENRRFDIIILSDLLFNHSQHDALLNTCEQVIAGTPSACVLVFYSHHRPHLAHRDMEFFEKARNRGWVMEKIITETFPPMFPEDLGDEAVRAAVHGWKLTRA